MKDGMSRRNFLKLLSGSGLLGMGVMVTGCGREKETAGGEGWMPEQYWETGEWKAQVRGRVAIDRANPTIIRDDNKCILCGQCAEVCKDVMSVHEWYPLPLGEEIPCVGCGQCTLWCPSGAISERYDIDKAIDSLNDVNTFTVVQTAPATKVSLGEEFGMQPGTSVGGKQVSALKELGFDAVLDTCYGADITIMEEAAEALRRITSRQTELPHLTSCCPGWVKFCEYFYPEMIPHLSSCKSPQGMMGAVIKSYYAKKRGIDPKSIVSVSIMPCTAKKFEITRQELENDGMNGIDIVLTTRELARLLKINHIDLNHMQEGEYDTLLGESSGAGRIFGTTGGVTEAAVRTMYYFATKQAPPPELLDWQSVRYLKSVKEGRATIPGVGEVRVAVCHGLSNARELIENIKANGSPWQFIEFMACPGGCIGGGGQPKSSVGDSPKLLAKRIAAIYTNDTQAPKRSSYENSEIQELYREFFGEPLSEKAEQYLHTHFVDRSGDIRSQAEKG